MPRPRRDGAASRATRRKRLTELAVRRMRAEATAYNVWDTRQAGLVLRVQPTGHRAWKVVYRHHGRPRWYHVGDASAIGLAAAREMAAEVMLKAMRGRDPAAERRAERGAGTFAELYDRYLSEHARKRNKSWEQADYLVRRHLLPRWAKLDARSITRTDVRAAVGKVESPTVANQTLAAASAVFSWAVRQEVVAANPCHQVERHKARSRERVLSDNEIRRFWVAFDDAGLVRSSALKAILLTGQRPGEVAHMRREHIIDGWWEMPGAPAPAVGWPGTKNGAAHRVWLSAPVRAVLDELGNDDGDAGFVFVGTRGGAIDGLDAAMRDVCRALGVNEKATPHDLRRTFSTKVTALGHGRDALNRVTNHKEGGIASVYDRHGYAEENKRVMEAVARHVLALVEGREGETVVRANFKR
jgi:integrase